MKLRKAAYIKIYQALIVLVSDWAKYDESTQSSSMHLIGNAKHDKTNIGSCPETMIDDTTLVSDDCYTEPWGKRLHFIYKSSPFQALREQVMKMNFTRPKNSKRLTLLSFLETEAIL